MSQKVLHILVLNFLPLIVTTNPGGGDTDLLQTVVDTAMCYVPIRDTVDSGDAGDGMVAAVGGALQNPAGTESRIVPC